MQEKKQFRKIKQLLCLLLVATLICGIVSIGSIFALENETTQGTEELSGVTNETIDGVEYLLPMVGLIGDNMDTGMRMSARLTATITLDVYVQLLDEYGNPLAGSYYEIWEREMAPSESSFTETKLLTSGITDSSGLIVYNTGLTRSDYVSSSYLGAIVYFTAPEGTTHLARSAGFTSANGVSVAGGPITRTDLISTLDKKEDMYRLESSSWSSSGSLVNLSITLGSESSPFLGQMLRQVDVTYQYQDGTTPDYLASYDYSYRLFNYSDMMPTPTREGYTFEGWYDAPTGGNLVVGTDTVGYTFPVMEGIGVGTPTEGTLYARWTYATITLDVYVQLLDEYGNPLADSYYEIWKRESDSSEASSGIETELLTSGTTDSNGLIIYNTVFTKYDYVMGTYIGARIYFKAPEGTTHVGRSVLLAESTNGGYENGGPITRIDPLGTPINNEDMYVLDGLTWRSNSGSLNQSVIFGSETSPYLGQMLRQVDVTYQYQDGTTPDYLASYDYSYRLFNYSDMMPTPTREGYTFEGWYDAPMGGNLVVGTDTVGYTFPVTEGIGVGTPTEGTLYAQWTLDTYTVTEKYVDKDGNSITDSGGTAVADTTQTIGWGENYSGNTTAVQDYVYIGYKIGNATDTFDTAGNAVYGSAIPTISNVTADQTVFFIYTKASITIKKYEDDGTTILPGAEFKLEKMTDATYTTVDSTFTALVGTTGSSGSLKFDNLTEGYYQITEVSAPSGFSTLKDPIEVELPYKSTATPTDLDLVTYKTTIDGTDTYYYYELTYTVTDQAVLEMPAAGSGFLRQLHLWSGIGMIFAAGVFFAFWLRRLRLYRE